MFRKVSLILSHWFNLIEGLNDSPQQFYSSLEQAIQKRGVPNLKISRVDYKEGGIFSAKREYCRIQRGNYIFDVCAAPYGNSFFVSWWLGESVSLFWSMILFVPFLGEFLLRTFKPMTYFRHDTALMFQESVRAAVLEVVDGITKAKGLRALSELERKPILTSFFNR